MVRGWFGGFSYCNVWVKIYSHSLGINMKAYLKFIIAGIGASSSMTVSLFSVDLQTSLQNVTTIVIIGYIIKWVLMFGIGILASVVLFPEENDIKKIFMLSIGAPALIIGIVNSNSIKPEVKEEPKREVRSAPMPATVEAKDEETTYKQLLRGLIGK